jgi:transcriptional regulator GlxA family with amidase domain
VAGKQRHVSLIAIPDAVISTLGGIYDVLSAFPAVAEIDKTVPAEAPFKVDIVGESSDPITLADGLPLHIQRSIAEIDHTDIVIVPSLLVSGAQWQKGRYPALVEWLRAMHEKGASLCSACSGVFLLGETGLFDGKPATVHWAFAVKFQASFPEIPAFPEKVLIATGEEGRLISSGASTSWHDLVLHLIAERVGAAAALAIARYYALEWHRDGLAPYFLFVPSRDHGDSTILSCQDWLADNFSVAHPVEEMTKLSGLTPRTFKRRSPSRPGSHRSPTSRYCGLRRQSADLKQRIQPSTRLVGRLVMRTPRSSAACSSAQRASPRAPTGASLDSLF